MLSNGLPQASITLLLRVELRFGQQSTNLDREAKRCALNVDQPGRRRSSWSEGARQMRRSGYYNLQRQDLASSRGVQHSARCGGWLCDGHELSHAMQGEARHSESGILKAQRSRQDYANMMLRRLAFTPRDVELIHLGLTGRVTGRVPQRTAEEKVHLEKR